MPDVIWWLRMLDTFRGGHKNVISEIVITAFIICDTVRVYVASYNLLWRVNGKNGNRYQELAPKLSLRVLLK